MIKHSKFPEDVFIAFSTSNKHYAEFRMILEKLPNKENVKLALFCVEEVANFASGYCKRTIDSHIGRAYVWLSEGVLPLIWSFSTNDHYSLRAAESMISMIKFKNTAFDVVYYAYMAMETYDKT